MLWHTSDVVGQRSGLIARLGRVEAKEFGKRLAILRVFVDTEFDVLAEGAVELVELFAVFGNLIEELKSLLDNVLLDDLHDLVLLKGLTRQVQGKILGIDNTLDEAEPLRNKVGSIVRDEDTTNVELDVVLRLLSLEKIKRRALGNEEDGTEFKLTFDGEMLDSKVVFPVAINLLVIFLKGLVIATYLDKDL